MNKSIYGAAAFLAFACSAQTGLAQDGSLSRPQFACADGAQCDSALWGINKQGYALIASLSVPRVYQVCMGHLPQNPTRWFNVYVKVDNVTLNFGDASLGAPLASGGCVVVEGKKIEVVNTGGSPFQRIQGFYRRVETTKSFTYGYSWQANPTGSVGTTGSKTPVYEGPALQNARVCFVGGDAEASAFWANQRNLVVNRKPLTRSDGSTTAVFGRHTCVDVEGTGIYAWREFDTNEPYPVGGAFYFSLP